ncbi:hypothetical protein [Streptomyces sp. NBC_01353]|uniref:hypothetical protein n=1 Tax=Streptomyces sp. NBC_01353 TaxID=2903835 RepID=UPI002E358EAA|nr:hypothetical protein [Streptomyces sp. NBC_01353]
MPASKAQQADTAARRAELVRLRRQGVPFDDDRILSLGYASRGAATKDLIRALAAHRDEEAAEVSVYRQQENERLDALLTAAWPQATKPRPVLDKEGQVVAHEIDMRAVDTVLRLMDRRAKLLGLDMPVKAEVTGPDGGALQLATGSLHELSKLIDIAGQTGPELHEPAEDDVDDLNS